MIVFKIRSFQKFFFNASKFFQKKKMSSDVEEEDSLLTMVNKILGGGLDSGKILKNMFCLKLAKIGMM